MIGSVLVWSMVTIISAIIVWIGSFWLESSSEELSEYYELPYIVKGSVVTAIGSSFPEISSVVLATLLHGDFDLGVGSVVGSAIFNILVIPAIAGLYTKKDMDVSRQIADKEAKFYMVAVSALIVLFSLAVIYNPINPGNDILRGLVTPTLAVIPILLYFVYIFDQWQEYQDSEKSGENYTTQDINVWKDWGLLVISLILIAVGVEGLVRSVLFFGEAAGAPSFLLGAVIIAVVTSVPDTIISVRQANAGQSSASLANVFGSNTFDLLIAVPAGIILAGGTIVNFSASIIMLAFLVAITVIVFIVIRAGLDLKKSESVLLLLIYGVFVLWIILESIGVLSVIPN